MNYTKRSILVQNNPDKKVHIPNFPEESIPKGRCHGATTAAIQLCLLNAQRYKDGYVLYRCPINNTHYINKVLKPMLEYQCNQMKIDQPKNIDFSPVDCRIYEVEIIDVFHTEPTDPINSQGEKK